MNIKTQVNVWRDGRNIYTECRHMKMDIPYIPIKSEEVAILQPCCCITIDINSTTNGIVQFSILPDLLTEGHNSKAQIKLRVGEKRTKLNLNVWREENTIWCEHNKYNAYKSSAEIESYSEEVVLKLPLPCFGPFNLNATGQAREKWGSEFLGNYSLINEEHRGRPVYRNKFGWFMFYREFGTWAVGSSALQCRCH